MSTEYDFDIHSDEKVFVYSYIKVAGDELRKIIDTSSFKLLDDILIFQTLSRNVDYTFVHHSSLTCRE
ncbi:unnamed protein product [Adineta ricciae]|uniref:Uncharacterized protein n=1 Tax=Adineta ricciae TaxID=249248 RepID=A0A814M0S8_ADIRI|nr:unnamed protein product [Adineta ricciae]